MLFLADESFFLFFASAGSGWSGAASGFSKRCVCARFSLRHARMGFHQKGSCSKTAQIYLNYLDNALFHALFVKFITVVSRSFWLRVPPFASVPFRGLQGFPCVPSIVLLRIKNNRQRIRRLFRIVVPRRSFSVLFSVLLVSALASIPVPVSRSSTPASSGAFGSFLRLRHLLRQGSVLRSLFSVAGSSVPVLALLALFQPLPGFSRPLSPVPLPGSAPLRLLFGSVS